MRKLSSVALLVSVVCSSVVGVIVTPETERPMAAVLATIIAMTTYLYLFDKELK